MLPAWLEVLRAALASKHGVKHGLAWVAAHTGLPIVVVAAIALVLAYRVAKRTAHVVIEVAVALVLLLLATKLGWIRW